MKSYLVFALRVAVALVIVNLILGALARFFPPLAFLKGFFNNPFALVEASLPSQNVG